MKQIEIEKMGSAVSRLALPRQINIVDRCAMPQIGDVVAVRALSESATYGTLELPTGRLAKINSGDILLGALGKRRALKGFVGAIAARVNSGDRPHWPNLGGVTARRKGP